MNKMSTSKYLLHQTLLLLLGAVILTACGQVEVGLEDTDNVTEPSVEDSQPPDNVIQAYQSVAAHLQSLYQEQAPSSEGEWSAENITPADLVGSGGYRFTIGDWQIEITYPIVAPESMIYNVTAQHTSLNLGWEGVIDADGQIQDSSTPMQAVAWPGRVIGGTQSDDLLFAIEGDVGTVRLTSGDETLVARLHAIRDDTGPQDFVHVWGTLVCSTTQEPQCSIEVTRIRNGREITDPEPVGPWEGTLFARTGPPSSGGDDWFTLVGDWPIQYGIWALDETLRTELEGLRDTGQVIRIWGELTVGFPDWNGTQINVTEFEFVD
jgi:hypothetical protein